MTARADLEGIAHAALVDVGLDDLDDVDAEEVAACHGFYLVPERGVRAWLDGLCIHVPMAVRDTRRNRLVAHELAHALLKAAVADNTEQNADIVAAGIVLSRRVLSRSLRVVGWNVDALRVRHPLVSAELIARRIADVRDAVVTIFDGRETKVRVTSPWIDRKLPPVTALERELRERALAEGCRVDDGWISATPILEPGYERVIVVAEYEQLSLRWAR